MKNSQQDDNPSFSVSDSINHLIRPPRDEESLRIEDFFDADKAGKAPARPPMTPNGNADHDTDDEDRNIVIPKPTASAYRPETQNTFSERKDAMQFEHPLSSLDHSVRSQMAFLKQHTSKGSAKDSASTRRSDQRAMEDLRRKRQVARKEQKQNAEKLQVQQSLRSSQTNDSQFMGLFASNIAPDLPRGNQKRLSKQKTRKGLKSQLTKQTDEEGGEYAPINDFDGQDFSDMEVDQQKKKKVQRGGSRSTNNDGVGADSLDNGAVLDNYDADMLERQSVDHLTLKEGYDYENKDFNQQNIQYPEGFNSEDDLNNDGQIDEMEHQLKVISRKDEIREQVETKVRSEYLSKFRKEVDFHHKVAYRYEKAYRLSKKQPDKKNTLNLEIIEIISEHSDYIEHDPMALFYCLYFCIYYNNPDLVEFLRTLINKMSQYKPEKIDQLLELIDVNGIQRLRTVGEQINLHVYHMVFYQSVDDDLRLVYSQMLRQLKFIQLRDQDALQLLNQRDYELIRLSFEKYTTKLNITLFFKKAFTLKSNHYRKYNEAFYEEILIDYDVEARVARNYRERFLVSPEEIKLVLEMYSKNDYVSHFLKIQNDISHSDYLELFQICLRNDSYKIAMQIYLRHLTNADITIKIMDILISTIKSSQMFHELKLFFIHQHFDVLTIEQLNWLVDIYMDILFRKDIKTNPMLAQYNTIKYSLLIYRISWKIERKKIYSLITKCSSLESYIQESLSMYLERQHHISQLYKFMTESIFHMTERKDSLDIMLEMNMETLLKHPVIVEVLNLAYEGKYSADSSALALSQTFQCFFNMETADLKSINERLLFNVKSFGDISSGKQSNLQFNIWKQCINQREQDEMLLTVLFCIGILFLNLRIDHSISQFIALQREVFGIDFTNSAQVFQNADPPRFNAFCQEGTDILLSINSTLMLLFIVVVFSCVGYLTAFFQKLVILNQRDNVELQLGRILLEILIVTINIFYFLMVSQRPENSLISDYCKDYAALSDSQLNDITFTYAAVTHTGGSGEVLNLQFVSSFTVVLFSLVMISMLQRTQKLGELIMMVNQMIHELKKFIFTFGLLIVGFMVVASQLKLELMMTDVNFYQTALNIFDGINGNQKFTDYTYPQGKLFIALFAFIFNILLLSFLVSMFINRYKFVWKNIDALRRMNIIKLKNSSSYDKLIGGVTLSFFPINVFLLPFIIPVVFFKSERLNDFILKIQYGFMIVMYCAIAVVLAVPLVPLLYLKSIFNAVYILFENKRQDYHLQNIVNFVFTLFMNPIIMVLSLFVDLLSLPSLLLKDERQFEFKYQNSLENMDEYQHEQVAGIYKAIFYENFEQKFQGRMTTFIQSMVQHRGIMRIVDNLHELCCRGTKDYKMALENVQDYNLAKILTRKCTIPHHTGDIKQSLTVFNILFAIQMDIELYNYVDILFKENRTGKLNSASQAGKDMRRSKTDEGKKVDGIRLHAGVVHISMHQAPSGMILQRDNADFMNNFFVNIVARTFTNIEKVIVEFQENNDDRGQRETMKEFEIIKAEWREHIFNEVKGSFDKFDSNLASIRRQYKQKMNLSKQTLSSIYNFMSSSKVSKARADPEDEHKGMMLMALDAHLKELDDDPSPTAKKMPSQKDDTLQDM